MTEALIILLAAHCYGDFLAQSRWMAEGKRAGGTASAGPLLAHALVHGLLAYLLLQEWSLWQVPLLVLLVHGLIDVVAANAPRTARNFAWDQLAHGLSLPGILWLVEQMQGAPVAFTGTGYEPIVLAAGFCATVPGAGFFIERAVGRIVEDNGIDLKPGLHGGGQLIGRLERALIFALMTIGLPMGIGFLVAAKSILRFEEAKKQPLAEYILIGTLWSFTLAIALSWATLQLL